jgi:hypothetical protein
MRLPPELECRLWRDIQPLERNMSMRYVTSVERIGIEKGHLLGLEQGRRHEAYELITRLLRHRFGLLPADLSTRIEALPLAEVEALSEALLDLTQLDEVSAWLDRH